MKSRHVIDELHHPSWSDVRLMMMAHDMSPPPPTLDDATLSAVRDSLGAYVRNGGGDPQLGEAMRKLASDAKAKEISAAHLLIVLKNLLSSLPELRQLKEPVEREQLKQRVITACIEEYYRK